MKSLLEAGVHFGHQTRRWDPRMRPFIFTQRNGIHIIDLQKSLRHLEAAAAAAQAIARERGDILFVGTKKQAQEAIAAEATRCGMPYVNQRWLGGTLTNFSTIRRRVEYMIELETQQEEGRWEAHSKKIALKLEEQLARLRKYFSGIRDMKSLPAAIFVIDMPKEDICVAEAVKLNISLISIIDSDCNPDVIDHYIPGNDDAIRSIRLITSRIADGAFEGLQERRTLQLEQEAAADELSEFQETYEQELTTGPVAEIETEIQEPVNQIKPATEIVTESTSTIEQETEDASTGENPEELSEATPTAS
ncbi:30S ribosomal protein S2 [SAR202 cluster bacterium AD-804-J14_MRT_500m]|nr:30S ribosomal protein S2 [SAR202 cluster bacterium AD-804-J14_MRT_500m]